MIYLLSNFSLSFEWVVLDEEVREKERRKERKNKKNEKNRESRTDGRACGRTAMEQSSSFFLSLNVSESTVLNLVGYECLAFG